MDASVFVGWVFLPPKSMKLQEIIAALKESCHKAEWWEYVQEDVKKRLDYIIENISVIGKTFREAFMALFKYEHTMRVITKTNNNLAEPTVLFGNKFPEEFYLSGIFPTKSLLKIDDWVEPNEADVYACMVLCQQIDALQFMKILADDTPISTTFLSEFLSSSKNNTEIREKT